MKEIQISGVFLRIDSFSINKSIKQLLNPQDFLKNPFENVDLLIGEKNCDERETGGDCDDGTQQAP